jgi:flagellar hook-associated protein 1 FlgK
MVSDPDGGDSLASRYTGLENALRALADTPESASTQATAVAAGRALATRFNTVSTEINRLRTELSDDVKTQVQTVNVALKKIAQLNTSIAAGRATGKDVTALEDERDRQLELVNSIVPIRSKERDNGGMMVSTTGGTLLVEGTAREIVLGGSSSAPTFMVDEFPVSTAGPSGGLQGGTLEASVTALTQTLPTFEGQVGAMVFDLVERFQTLPGYDRVDGTTPLKGLFVLDGTSGPVRLPAFLSLEDTVDAGNIDQFREAYGIQGADDAAAYQTARDAEAAQYAIDFPNGTADFAKALRLNPAVDPQAGGDASILWRRDQTGYAPADGMILRDTGQSFPSALMAAMRSAVPSSVAGLSGSFGATDLAMGLMGLRETDASTKEADASFQRAATLAVREQEQAGSAVDTDAELQDLLRIEQAYAANARVLEIANSLVDRLLEI